MDKSLLQIARNMIEKTVDPETMEIYRMALDNIHYFVIIITMDKKIVYMNKRFCKFSGLTPNEGIGKKCDSEDINITRRYGSTCAFNKLAAGVKFSYFAWNDEDYECESDYVLNEEGDKIGIIELFTTIGKDMLRFDLEHELSDKVRYDSLTKLYTRTYFYERTRRLLDVRTDEDYVMIHWNVRRFKVVNDVFGHATGDRVLVNISEKIMNLVGNEGTYGRFSDDNFVMCIPRRKVSEEWFNKNAAITLISDTVAYTFKSTFGIYVIANPSIGINAMCDRAKMAQESVRRFDLLSGQCFAYYNAQMRKKMLEEQELSSQMSLALQENQFVTYFQPIYSVTTGRVISAEALVRWIHPTKGLILPGIFIPLFERNGLISQLDSYVWNQVATALEEQISKGEPCVPISINVSRVDFYTSTLVEDLCTIVDKHHIPKELLHIEVTETAYADDPGKIVNIVRDLRQKGFSVLLDDFGSGYSSFNSLKDIPVDILKVDLKFLEDFDKSQRAGNIIASIVRMARWLDLEIVAEGVETEEQVKFLNGVGCDRIQGYYYSHPLPIEEFKDLLKAEPVKVSSSFLMEDEENISLAVTWNTSREASALFNCIIGAVGFYELVRDNLELIRVNREYCELLNGDAQTVFEEATDILRFVPQTERYLVLDSCRESARTKKISTVYVHRRAFDGRMLLLRLRIRYLGGIGCRTAYYIALDELPGVDEDFTGR